MPTNLWFNNYENSGEQNLLSDLIIEQIKIYGIDMYYVIRTENNYDKIYGADDISSYDNAVLCEMYLNNPGEGFASSGTFMSKFGNEIRDQLTFSVAVRTFEKEIRDDYDLEKPRAGDLLYFGPDNKCFKITFVDTKTLKYPMGILPVYKLEAELFDYSNEIFNTGIDEIDSYQKDYSTNVLDYSLRTQDGNYLTDSYGNILVSHKYNLEEIDNADNTELINQAIKILDFSEDNPFGEVE